MAAPEERINHAVDATDTFDRKIAALREHSSQTAHIENNDSQIRLRHRSWAERCGWGDGRLAEAFQTVPIG
jgi:hypothetical protein